MPNNYSSMNVNPRTSTARSNKRALLCGVTYNNKRKYRLKGTINDVQDMRDLLITKFGYPDHSIRVLTGMLNDQLYNKIILSVYT